MLKITSVYSNWVEAEGLKNLIELECWTMRMILDMMPCSPTVAAIIDASHEAPQLHFSIWSCTSEDRRVTEIVFLIVKSQH